MRKEIIPGVYIINNKINTKFYIGRSIDILKRWDTHKSELRRNIHENQYLQNAWNKYGEENFDFDIIEKNIDTRGERVKREQYYLDLYKPYNRDIGYNISKVADNSDRGTRQPILQYTIEGTFMKGWKSISDAERSLCMSNGTIGKACSGESISSKGFAWRYNTGEKIEQKIIIPASKSKKTVLQYDLEGIFLKEWRSIMQAAKGCKLSNSTITDSCLGFENNGKFIWKFKYKEDKNIAHNNLTFINPPIPILQYDIDGNFVEEFKSIIDASRKIGHNLGFRDNERGYSHSYIWKLKNGEDYPKKIEIKKFFDKKETPVALYGLNNKLINVFESVTKAAEETHISAAHIFDRLSDKIKKQKYFIWKRITNEQYIEFEKYIISNTKENKIINISDIIKESKILINSTPIYQYDVNGNFTKEWESVSFASKVLRKSITSINKACSGIFKTAYGYVWRYKSDVKGKKIKLNINEVNRSQNGALMQFNLNDVFVKEWKNMSEAGKSLKIDPAQIGRVCSDKHTDKTAGGYIWKHKNKIINNNT